MINISELMALAESSTGFIGGGGYDDMPELSLTEATAALPLFLVETQMKWTDDVEAYNQLIVETTVTNMRYGTIDESAMDAIMEASMESVKNKVAAFFKKILNFLKSIIEKLKFQINKIRMSGKQLWAKYKDSARAKNFEAFKDYKYNGYKNMFGADKVNFAKASEYDNPNGGATLINAAIQADLADPTNVFNSFISKNPKETDEQGMTSVSDAGMEKINSHIEALRDKDSGEVKARMAEKLTGESGLDDDWQTTIREKLYGDKEDLEYGKDFNIEQIGKMCENPEDLEKMEKEYTKFQNSVNKYKSDIEKAISGDTKLAQKTSENEGYRRTVLNKGVEYMNAFIDRLNDAYAVISEVKNIRVTYYKAKNDQARAILGQLLSRGGGKAKKSENSDSSFEDDELMMFELD